MPKSKGEILLANLEGCALFTDQDRVHLLLVLDGLKSVCSVEINSPDRRGYDGGFEDECDSNAKEFERDGEMLEQMLRELDLPYAVETGHVDENGGYAYKEFIIGKDRNSLADFQKTESDPEAEKSSTRARQFGIPETAIEAWRSGKLKDPDSLPDDVKNGEVIKFLDFALSEDHWKEELAVIEKIASVTKSLAPDLYQKIVASE